MISVLCFWEFWQHPCEVIVTLKRAEPCAKTQTRVMILILNDSELLFFLSHTSKQHEAIQQPIRLSVLHYSVLYTMADQIAAEEGQPPAIAALSIAGDADGASKVTEQVIDPWSVKAATDAEGNDLAFDYEAISKLLPLEPRSCRRTDISYRKWATKLIDQATLERFEKLTGHKPHRWMRRGLFFSHRDFDLILVIKPTNSVHHSCIWRCLPWKPVLPLVAAYVAL
jgi:hypothetical protein